MLITIVADFGDIIYFLWHNEIYQRLSYKLINTYSYVSHLSISDLKMKAN